MKQIYTRDYTLSQSGYQLMLPLNLEAVIPSDDKVRLLSQFVEEMDLTDLFRSVADGQKRGKQRTVI